MGEMSHRSVNTSVMIHNLFDFCKTGDIGNHRMLNKKILQASQSLFQAMEILSYRSIRDRCSRAFPQMLLEWESARFCPVALI